MSGQVQASEVAGLTAERSWLYTLVSQLWRPSLRTQRLAYRCAVVALVLIGVYFRSRRYWVEPLGVWMDEAVWGLRLLERPLTRLEFRPIGYMALTKLIVGMYSDERTLRSLSYLAGVLSLPLTANLAKYLFKSRIVRLVSLAIVAYHPLLIDMAREFKPYSVEFALHLTLVWLFVRYRVAHSRAWLRALLVASVLAFPFAYNIVFLLPGIFIVLGYMLLRGRAYRALSLSVLAALAALAVIVAIYLIALRTTAQDPDETGNFWGKKYDVFYVPNAQQAEHPSARALWLLSKYRDLAAFPGSHGPGLATSDVRAPPWTLALAANASLVWLALHALGLAALIGRRRQWLVLLCGPLLVNVVFNALSLWPFGAFRTNVFLLAYLIPIPLVGLDVLLAAKAWLARAAGALGAGAVLLAGLSAGFEPHTRKHFFSTQTEMHSLIEHMAVLRERLPAGLKAQTTPVVLDGTACMPFIFESRHNQSFQQEFGALLSRELDARCVSNLAGAETLLRHASGHAFFVVTTPGRSTAGYEHLFRGQARVVAHEDIHGVHDLFLIITR